MPLTTRCPYRDGVSKHQSWYPFVEGDECLVCEPLALVVKRSQIPENSANVVVSKDSLGVLHFKHWYPNPKNLCERVKHFTDVKTSRSATPYLQLSVTEEETRKDSASIEFYSPDDESEHCDWELNFVWRRWKGGRQKKRWARPNSKHSEKCKRSQAPGSTKSKSFKKESLAKRSNHLQWEKDSDIESCCRPSKRCERCFQAFKTQAEAESAVCQECIQVRNEPHYLFLSGLIDHSTKTGTLRMDRIHRTMALYDHVRHYYDGVAHEIFDIYERVYHDGHDSYGPQSHIYDLYVWTLHYGVPNMDIWHREYWYCGEDDELYYLHQSFRFLRLQTFIEMLFNPERSIQKHEAVEQG